MEGRAAATDRDAAWAAFERGDWDQARLLFERLLEQGDDPDALDGLGQVLWFLCDIAEGIALREQAYAALRRGGDACRAGDIALWLSIEYASSYANDAAASGWFRRGERLLEGLPLCVPQVELEVQRARRATSPDEAERHYERALAIARELGEFDHEIRALSQLGIHRIALGHTDEGMALLDESMAAATGGEMCDPWQIGGACCSMLAVCDEISDFDRAAQWCRVVVDFTRRRRWVPLFAWCRSAYAGVLTATGEWEGAEQQLEASLQAYGGPGQPMTVYPLARLAELRLRQGRIDEAARLIAGHESHARAAKVAIEVQLARGEAGPARRTLERRLGALAERHAAAATLLPLLVDAQLAEGDAAAARVSADRLLDLGRAIGRESVVAAAELAAGRVCLAVRDDAAVAHLELALAGFARLGTPLDEGRARLELARALAGDDRDQAAAEARRALALFERLGALRDADGAAAFLRSLGGAGRSAPRLDGELTSREREVLAVLGEGLSNAQIAERLVISPKTAEHHVGRILRKLGLKSRAEATAYAVRAGAPGPGAR
jgi:DNA-binding CsgD family transcriptional regulator